jgi:lysophospholipase L1-like esterase
MSVKNNINVLLFQGDSITDAGRSRMGVGPKTGDDLGFGYPRLVADQLLVDYQDHHLQFYNRGISGDQIRDMVFRWDQDAIQLQPDLISILIGVNDTWNYIYLGMGSSPDEYRRIYRNLLSETRSKLPNAQFVLCEPFILMTGEVSQDWVEDISIRQAAVKDMASEFEGTFVPFQSALDDAVKQIDASQLLDDGVHPTNRGHKVLADCWIKTVFGPNK